MSVWHEGERVSSVEALSSNRKNRDTRPKVTVPSLLQKKHSALKITCVTSYDCPSARLADEAGLDLVLVGDSLAMVMLGHESTLAVTMDEMLIFTRAARRGLQHALLVADMPFGSYQADPHDALRNAIRFVKEGGAEAVKLEGGRERADLVRRLVDAEIPVMGHIGLTPQAVNRMGGYKVQAKSSEHIEQLREEAHLLAGAGCFSIVLEGIPREVAGMLTSELPIPTIGIGAGPDCDGQILVWHDLLGLGERAPAKFVRRYLDSATLMREALSTYRSDVETGSFPSDDESYHLPRKPHEAGAEQRYLTLEKA